MKHNLLLLLWGAIMGTCMTGIMLLAVSRTMGII